MRERIIQEILDKKIIAIVRGVDEAQAVSVAKALYDGGVRVLEFTFDHNEPDYMAANAAKIRYTVEKFGDQVIVLSTCLSGDNHYRYLVMGVCKAEQ